MELELVAISFGMVVGVVLFVWLGTLIVPDENRKIEKEQVEEQKGFWKKFLENQKAQEQEEEIVSMLKKNFEDWRRLNDEISLQSTGVYPSLAPLDNPFRGR